MNHAFSEVHKKTKIVLLHCGYFSHKEKFRVGISSHASNKISKQVNDSGLASQLNQNDIAETYIKGVVLFSFIDILRTLSLFWERCVWIFFICNISKIIQLCKRFENQCIIAVYWHRYFSTVSAIDWPCFCTFFIN